MASHPEQRLLWVLPPSHNGQRKLGWSQANLPHLCPNTHRPLCSLSILSFPHSPVAPSVGSQPSGWQSGGQADPSPPLCSLAPSSPRLSTGTQRREAAAQRCARGLQSPRLQGPSALCLTLLTPLGPPPPPSRSGGFGTYVWAPGVHPRSP